MPNLNQANERHARYYLRVVQVAISGEISVLDEVDVVNVRKAWIWVSQVSRDPELIIAYGEVAWQLFEATRVRLSETLLDLEKLKLSGADAILLGQIVQKLDDVMHAQSQLRSALKPNISASGERSVAGAIIMNSTVITGDNVVIQKEQERDIQDTDK